MIRPYEPRDRQRLREITAEVFGPAAVDYHIERRFGIVQRRDWRWRKLRHVDDDIRSNATGIFVYENLDGALVGFVSVHLDRDAGIGRVADLAVAADAQGRGIGRALLDHALEYIAAEQMMLARIETLVGNAAGEYLYPAMGFEEVSRQIHFVKRVRDEAPLLKLLYVVARDRPWLYERLRHEFAHAADIEVVLDRRVGERRRAARPLGVAERRQADRRQRKVEALLRQHGCALVPRAG
jgi:ribosomal protein S18 acetylase RimI-like enzyme